MHPSRLRVYEKAFEVFSTCNSHTPNHRRQFLAGTPDHVENTLLADRALPQAYERFLQHSPLFVPSGWIFYDYSSTAESSIISRNSRLLEENALPDGWLCFLNVADDDLYFFSGLNRLAVEDAPIVHVDTSSLDDLPEASDFIAPRFVDFLHYKATSLIGQIEQSVSRIALDCRELGDLLKNG